MKRVLVIGCPGSGKSTFARRLSEMTGFPLVYLDMLFHKADRTTCSKEEFDEQLIRVLERDEWILDGNYARTLGMRLERCDTVFWLDYPTEVCLAGVRSRRGKPREGGGVTGFWGGIPRRGWAGGGGAGGGESGGRTCRGSRWKRTRNSWNI